MKQALAVVVIGLCVALVGVFLRGTHIFVSALLSQDMPASVFSADTATPEQLLSRYERAKKSGRDLRILIVPGHDAEYHGTEFKGLRELDLNLAVADELYSLLAREPHVRVYRSQTKAGYTSVFETYFEKEAEEILAFMRKSKEQMGELVDAGTVESVVNVPHNAAPTAVALRLYGINRWANENDIDVVIHIHFNDYGGRKARHRGAYSGFSVYVPESQYSNAKGSRALAESISSRLDRFYHKSDLPKEDTGVVEDQELIAIGASNTLESAGILIEYGYIYESQFENEATRAAITNDLALQTYLGVMDFFGEERQQVAGVYGTLLVPHEWHDDLAEGTDARREVLSLQAALVLADMYPPQGVSENECPLSGYFGTCTSRAIQEFQKLHDIKPAAGYVGPKTRAVLNTLYE